MERKNDEKSLSLSLFFSSLSFSFITSRTSSSMLLYFLLLVSVPLSFSLGGCELADAFLFQLSFSFLY